MKILFLSHYFPPEGNAPASRVYEFCRRWATAGHDVTVITCAPNVPNGKVYPGYKNRLSARETRAGVKVLRVWTYIAPNKGTFRRSLNYFSYMVSATIASAGIGRPDIVVATSPQFFCGFAGLLVSRIRRLPFVLEIRDIWPESVEAVGAVRNRGVLGLLGKMERRMYDGASHIVTVGEGYKLRLGERGVAGDKVTVIHNAADRSFFHPREPNPDLLNRYGLKGRFVCSYIGTIGMASGLEVVLRAARLLKGEGRDDIAFLLVGDGAIKAELEKKARGEKLDNVVFAGLQPKNAVPEFLAASNACLVHLRKQELFTTVFPSKLLEAAAMRKPVILGVEGYAAEYLRNAGGGVAIPPENEIELAYAVKKLASDADLCRQMGDSAAAYLSQHFDLDVLASSYLSLLIRTADHL